MLLRYGQRATSVTSEPTHHVTDASRSDAWRGVRRGENPKSRHVLKSELQSEKNVKPTVQKMYKGSKPLKN